MGTPRLPGGLRWASLPELLRSLGTADRRPLRHHPAVGGTASPSIPQAQKGFPGLIRLRLERVPTSKAAPDNVGTCRGELPHGQGCPQGDQMALIAPSPAWARPNAHSPQEDRAPHTACAQHPCLLGSSPGRAGGAFHPRTGSTPRRDWLALHRGYRPGATPGGRLRPKPSASPQAPKGPPPVRNGVTVRAMGSCRV